MKSKIVYTIRVAYAATVATLIAATVADKIAGDGYSAAHIYSSWWFCALWAALAVAGVALLARKRRQRRPAVFALHTSFILILLGALTTHIWGEQGMVRIREGAEADAFLLEDGNVAGLPFSLTLNKFEIKNYPGTDSPMDYVSHVSFADRDGNRQDADISMNNIAEHSGYRFYQTSYDADGKGTVLSVSHDPAGIGITYAGYALLFVSLTLLLTLPGETFRRSIKTLRAKVGARAAALMAAMLAGGTASALPTEADAPPALPAETAARYGDLHAYYNGRVCPLQTAARDFTLKLYGRDTYMGLTPEQVMMGWTLDAPRWRKVRMIRIKGAAAREIGLTETLTSFDRLAGGDLGERAGKARRGGDAAKARALAEAEEKADIVRMLFAGQMLKVFPLADSTGRVTWYSPADALPAGTGEATSAFIRNIFGEAVTAIGRGDTAAARAVADKVRIFQAIATRGTDAMPPASRFRAEKAYNSLGVTRPLAMAMTAVGVIFFFIVAYLWGRGITSRAMSMFTATLSVFLGLAGAYLLAMFCLRWYVGGHLPLSNGYETMQFMSLCVIALALPATRRFALALPFGYLMAGLTLMVSMMGESNPQVTNLTPVLQSPLLSVHVCLVMMAYTLLAFTALNGLTALVIKGMQRGGKAGCERIETLACISRALLTPAVALLTAGIFVGAIWANQSWGRYWGWDPKEVWALITMMVYAIPFHPSVAGGLDRPVALHVFLLAAFACVLMTYFGVNFLLGGMHSYA